MITLLVGGFIFTNLYYYSQLPAHIQETTQCGPLEGIDCSQLEEWLSDITVEKVLEDVPKMTASKKKKLDFHNY